MKSYSRIISLLLALIMSLSLMATAFAADGDFIPEDDLALVTSFSDVKSTAWYYSDVTECAKLGVVSGYSDGTFKPNNNVTYVEFMVMLTRTFYNAKVEAVKDTAGKPWYYPYTQAARDVGLDARTDIVNKGGWPTIVVANNAINRYEMAAVIRNILIYEGKVLQFTTEQKNAATTALSDWSKIPTQYQADVKNCYASGVIMGNSDGTFGGTGNMARAQACTIIVRLLKLINNYNPGDKDNDQYDDGTSQNTSNNNQSNVTTAYALQVLANLKKQYPTGTVWDETGTNKYSAGLNSTDVLAVTNKFYTASSSGRLRTSTTLGCGGWAAMVSDAIFGQSGAPAHEVTDPSKVRPGDICILLNASGQLKHVSVAASTATYVDGKWRFDTCEGNKSGKVAWETNGANMWSNANGALRVWTRYAD